MEKKQNPFESLRNPGIVGSVVGRTYKTQTIYQHCLDFIQIRTGELCPGKWGFGFLMEIDGARREMLPGEGAGWFSDENDAALYALGHIRNSALTDREDIKWTIDKAIDKLRNVPLFDFEC